MSTNYYTNSGNNYQGGEVNQLQIVNQAEQHNQTGSPKYGSMKKKMFDQNSQSSNYQNEFNPNTVQHIVLIAKKIEKQQRRDQKTSPIAVLGEHNYRVQTAHSNIKWGRQIQPQFPSNLIKGQAFYDTYNNWNMNKGEIGSASANTPSSMVSYQQQQLLQQQHILNSIGRTQTHFRNHPQSAFQGTKPDILTQIHQFQYNQQLKNSISPENVEDNDFCQTPKPLIKQSYSNGQIDGNKQIQSMLNQNTSPGQQKNIFSEKSTDQSSQMKASFNNNHLQNRSPLQLGRQLYVNELNRQISEQNHNFSAAFQQAHQVDQQSRVYNHQQTQSNYGTYNTQVSPMQSSYVPPVLNNQESHYKYIVNYGNNCLIVKRVMETRENWRAIEPHNTAYNFRWCPISQAVKFDRIGVGMKQLVNHLEFHKELTCKYTLVKNLKPYCEQNKINLLNVTPLTFLIDLDDENCDSSIRKFAKFFYKNMPKNSSVVKRPDNVKKTINEFAKRLKPLMQYPMQEKKEKPCVFTKPKMHDSFANGENYFWFLKPTGTNRGRGIYIFNTLEQLEKYIQEYYVGMEEKPIAKKKENPPTKVELNNPESTPQVNENLEQEQPQPQVMQQADIVPEEQDFKNKFQYQNQVFQQLFYQNSQQLSTVSPYLKPNDHQSPERNVNVQNQDNQDYKKRKGTSSNIASSKEPVSIIKCHQFVVQKYVERPMLINNRKFDIRAWVLVTHTMDVYFFKESVIRTSGQKFNLDNNQINNHFIHLTNNAVQRYAENYGEFENGNQMSLASFFKYCKDKHPNECDTDKMHQDMKNIVYHTMNCVKRKINPEDRKFTFEIYGYDFLIDDKFNVWLLEINTNPCLDESSPHLEQVLPRMLDDAFKMTLDVIFPKTKIINKQHVINKSNSSNINQTKITTSSLHQQQVINIGTTNDIEQQQEQKGQIKKEEQVEIQDTKEPQAVSNIQGDKPNLLAESKVEISEISSPITNITHQESQASQSTNAQTSNITQSSAISPNLRSHIPYRLNPKKETNWPVNGHPDDESMWEFLLNIYCPKPKIIHSSKKSTF